LISEVDVNRWILRYLNTNLRVLSQDEIAVTEACSPCLRKAYYSRTRASRPTPVEFVKLAGTDMHVMLQSVLSGEGWDVEVSVALPLSDYGFTLVGRVDAVRDGEVIEFKTSSEVPEQPYRSHELQVQAYMQVLNARRGYIIYLSRTSGRVKVFLVRPDKQALRQVIQRARKLHEALKNGAPPEPTKGPWCNTCQFFSECVR
jgi:CRISPR-associated exonuclease Cas4